MVPGSSTDILLILAEPRGAILSKPYWSTQFNKVGRLDLAKE